MNCLPGALEAEGPTVIATMAQLLAEDNGTPTELPSTVDEDGWDYDDADFMRAAGLA